MSFRAQLLPDEHGCTALRKLLLAAITAHEGGSRSDLTSPEVDACYELFAKLTQDMRRLG